MSQKVTPQLPCFFIPLIIRNTQWNPSNQDPWNVATPVFRPLLKSPNACFLIQIHPWNVATPLIRTFSLVPSVAGLEGFHCILSNQDYVACDYSAHLATYSEKKKSYWIILLSDWLVTTIFAWNTFCCCSGTSDKGHSDFLNIYLRQLY